MTVNFTFLEARAQFPVDRFHDLERRNEAKNGEERRRWSTKFGQRSIMSDFWFQSQKPTH